MLYPFSFKISLNSGYIFNNIDIASINPSSSNLIYFSIKSELSKGISAGLLGYLYKIKFPFFSSSYIIIHKLLIFL